MIHVISSTSSGQKCVVVKWLAPPPLVQVSFKFRFHPKCTTDAPPNMQTSQSQVLNQPKKNFLVSSLFSSLTSNVLNWFVHCVGFIIANIAGQHIFCMAIFGFNQVFSDNLSHGNILFTMRLDGVARGPVPVLKLD